MSKKLAHEINTSEEKLTIKDDGHLYVDSSGNIHWFEFGSQNDETKERYDRMKSTLDDGYFEKVVDEAKEAWDEDEVPSLGAEKDRLISRVLHGVQHQGRGIAGVFICQLCISDIEPKLNTRLHKGGRRGRAYQRWKDGISIRSVDDNYITTVLNDRDLLLGNSKGGSTMTRMLSVNLPYAKVTFDGQMRGPTSEWLELVDMIENPDRDIDTHKALIRALSILYNMKSREDETYEKCKSNIQKVTEDEATDIILTSIKESDMSSELMELATYSAFLSDYKEEDDYDLSRMSSHRAADSKSGRIDDIEIRSNGRVEQVWDAKFERGLSRREWRDMKDLETESRKGVVSYSIEDAIEVPDSASVIPLRNILKLDRTTDSASEWLKEYVDCLGKYNVDMVDFNHNTTEVLDKIVSLTEESRS